jgi:hypothetical protein
MSERCMGDVLWDPGSGREVVVTGASFGMVTVSDLKTYEKATGEERKFDLWVKVGLMCPSCEVVTDGGKSFVAHECSRRTTERGRTN